MGILKKLGDLARANINAFLDQVEDKKKLSDQALLDAQEQKAKAKKMLISAMAALTAMERQKDGLYQTVAKLSEQAEAFLRNNQEEQTKTTLAEKQTAQAELDYYEAEIAQQKQAIKTIERGILALEKHMEETRIQSGQKHAHDTLHKEDAFATFDRMEEKIGRSEDEVLALQELLAYEEKDDKKPTVSPPFDKHSDPEALEKELAALKKKLNG